MKRRSNSFSEYILYPKSTLYLRVAQMILCIVCLILAFYFWISENTLLGATVVLFATSFGFLVVTVVDVLASLKHRQYTAPVWVGLAFLAAFMFFLSFGFMVLQPVILYIVIGVIFAVTGIVFLIDGILIIVYIYKSKSPGKVHPIPDDKGSIDQTSQVEDDLEIIEEVPVEIRKVAPVATAPSKKSSDKSSPKSPFPITSYGGTFPVGGSDAAPLPTPDNLVGIEPARPAQLYVPKKTRENSPDAHSISSENSANRRASLDESRNLYPTVMEENAQERSIQLRNERSHAMSEPGISQQIQSTTYSAPPTYRQNYDQYLAEEMSREQQAQRPYYENVQGGMITPYQAAGEPQSTLNVDNGQFEARYHREMMPGDAQACQCCGTRLYEPREPEGREHEAREQITPFVTHHYNQSPCICGYTHYQASTVVKGAVRQYPEDTLKQQQRMIKEQLEQMRDDHVFHGCSCHDKPTKETNVPYMHLVRSSPCPDNRKDSSSLASPTHKYVVSNEVDSNRSLNIETESQFEEFGSSFPKWMSSRGPVDPTDPNVEDRNRKVTIGTLDVISPSDASTDSNSSKYRRWAERLGMSQLAERDHRTVNVDPVMGQPKRPSLKHRDDEIPARKSTTSPSSFDEGNVAETWRQDPTDISESMDDFLERRPTIEKVKDSITPLTNPRMTVVSKKDEANYLKRFREVVYPTDSSKETVLSANMDFISREPENGPRSNAHNSEIDESLRAWVPEHDSKYSKRTSTFGAKEVLDSYELIMENRAMEPPPPDDTQYVQTLAPETASVRSRRMSTDKSTGTKRPEQPDYSYQPGVERPFFDDREKTWKSEAQEAYRSSVAGLPCSPRRICQSVSPECVCCQNPKDELVRPAMRVVEERRYSSPRARNQETRYSSERGRDEERRYSSDRGENEDRRHSGDTKRNSYPEERRLVNEMNFRRVSTMAPKPYDEASYVDEITSHRTSDGGTREERSKRDSQNYELKLDSRKSLFPGSTYREEKVVLPRMLDPIQEQRMTENIHLSDSEERVSHIPPFHDGFPRDVMMIKKMSCICECICNPQKGPKDNARGRRNLGASNVKRYETEPLNQQPYHPKDDFKMPENSFTNFSRISERPDDSGSVGSRKRKSSRNGDHQTIRFSLNSPTPRKTLDCVEKCPDCSSRREAECPEECSTCPVRRRRLAREARLRERLDYEERLSIPKRGSLKRAYPDERR
ncbi:uncharacterized protein LOC123316720 [Coccinella septempunctata]|uniref:uncharacterized protein LOC123316720 n=1 Tax=Coccinella septempunctata TaxID=41139 RepID=UPI001D075BEE|nr:uncharacterized protein LOC123316720 [Coccinella septempunctata]